MGVRKLHYMIYDKLRQNGLKISRDALFSLLRDNHLLSRLRRRFKKTTNSNHERETFPNLLKENVIKQPKQVLVSDITYLVTQEGFCYLALITDAYSRKIVGYELSRRMKSELALRALKNACSIHDLSPGFIHHSDRGSQYCSKEYISYLRSRGAQISMTGDDHCYDNALAERVNGILKTEFGLSEVLKDFKTAMRLVKDSIALYNSFRPHLSLNYRTPDAVFYGSYCADVA